jgi:hypothetical protein
MKQHGYFGPLRLLAGLLVLLALLASGAPAPALGLERDDPAQRWIGTWSASPMRPDPTGMTPGAFLSRAGFVNQTLREIVFAHAGGEKVRRIAEGAIEPNIRVGVVELARTESIHFFCPVRHTCG